MDLNQRNRIYENVWIEERGTKNDVNLIIISKVKKCTQSENDIIKEVLPGKHKIREKKVSGMELQEGKESLFLRVIGCKILVF